MHEHKERENNVGVGLIYPTEEGTKHIELADEAHAHKAPIVARDWFLLAVSAGDLRKRQRRDKSEENRLVQKTSHELTHPPGARPGAALRARGALL